MRNFLTLLLLFCVLSASAQHTKTPPKKGGIALTLSGGGAKGLYHVGIIKALEENEIPIDYISGASMGAIVASLYASGWSPEQMWDFFLTDSVSTWLSGKIPEEYNNYYSRFEPTSEMINIDLLRDTTKQTSTLKIPTNLIPPDMLDMAFLKLLGPPSAACGENFDNLMVPFRCVATDTYNKRIVEFRDEYLPFAVRTSMTIPLVFKPLEKDSTLLYDGGIFNNFPWQILEKDFAPAHIIGGICTDNFDKPTQDNLANQISALATRNTDYEVPDTLNDVFIKRVMPYIGILEYNRADTIMTLGYNDAMAQMDKIKEIIKERRPKATLDSIRASFVERVPELTFDSIVITGLTHSQENYVRRQLQAKDVEHFTYEYFYDNYMTMIAAGVFTADFPELRYNHATGYYQIHLNMATKTSIRFSLGGNISSSSLNQGYVGAKIKNTTSFASTYSLDGHFGMFYNALKLGGRHDFFDKYPYYLNYQIFCEGLNYDGSNMQPYYENKEFRTLDQTNVGGKFSFSAPILKNSALRINFTAAQSYFKYHEGLYTSVDSPSQTRFGFVTIAPEIETSSTNYTIYPNKGTKQTFSLRYTLGLEDYLPGSIAPMPASYTNNQWWVELNYEREQYIELGRWFTLGYNFSATVSNHPEFKTNIATEITAPRFAPTPQMESMFMPEFCSPSYIAGGILPIFNFLPNDSFYLKSYLYAFIPQELFVENGSIVTPTAQRFEDYVNFIMGGSLVYQTPIGPASITVAKYSTGPKNWCFQFNFGYTIFNNMTF